jgi:two-component system cell cycle response regulator
MLTSEEPKTRAKNALFKLLELSLPPTPENFTRFFYENDLPSVEDLFRKLLGITKALAEASGNSDLEKDLLSIETILRSDELALSSHPRIDQLLDNSKSRLNTLSPSSPSRSLSPDKDPRFFTLHSPSDDQGWQVRKNRRQAESLDHPREEASQDPEAEDRVKIDPTFEKMSQEASKLQSQMDHIRSLIQSMESRVGVIQKHNKKVSREANIDPLTGVLNRRGLQNRLNFIKEPILSLLIFDLDDFKVVNDTFGHNTGDEVLKKVATGVRSLVRKVDLFSRLGGDEFVILMPGLEIEQAKIVAERIRDQISKIPVLVGNGSVHVTASFGLTGTYVDGAKKMDDLLELADSALYQGKNQGKNQICITNPIV